MIVQKSSLSPALKENVFRKIAAAGNAPNHRKALPSLISAVLATEGWSENTGQFIKEVAAAHRQSEKETEEKA